MARGFNTQGVNTSDIITTAFTTATPSLCSWSFWFWMVNNNPAGNPRFFQKDNTTNNLECLYVDTSAGLHFNFQFPWSGANAAWAISPSVSSATWYPFVLTYDSSSTSNDPIPYLNATVQSFSRVTAPSGTAAALTDPLTIGNRAAGGRVWDGRFADFAIWHGIILSPSEVSALTKGVRPSKIRPKSLVHWEPLDGLQSPEPDLSGNAKNGTLTGTASSFGPPIMPFTPRWVSPSLVLPVAGLDWIIRRRNKLRIEGEA